MSYPLRATSVFVVMAALLLLVGFAQSWNVALALINLCLISAVMALGAHSDISDVAT